MVLHANNQPGPWGGHHPPCLSFGKCIVPSHTDGNTYSSEEQLNTTFSRDIHGYLFNAMDPFKVNLFSKKITLPIIQMVFALASKEGAVKYVLSPRTTRQSKHPGKYTSYDIWCAKIS